MRVIRVIVLVLLWSGLANTQATIDVDVTVRFARAYNNWINDIQHISDVSPDWLAKVRESFHKNEVGQRFRDIEKTIGANTMLVGD